jgi:hypothetical protein
MDMRRNHGRRKGEANGRICWRSIFGLLVDLLLVIGLMCASFGMGRYYEKVHKEILLKDVPITEYRRVK